MQDQRQSILGWMILLGTPLLTLAIAKGLDRLKRPRPRDGKDASGIDRSSRRRTAGWVRVFLIVVVLVVVYICVPSKKGKPPQVRAPWDAFRTSSIIAAPIILAVVLVGIVWLRHRDPIWAKASRMADQGDVDGAIEDVLEAHEVRRPTATRVNNLGTLYYRNGDFQRALKCYLQAEGLGGRLPHFLHNQSSVLRKLGRPEEALALAEEVLASQPLEPIYRCNEIMLLADLGRLDEARERLRSVETMRFRISRQLRVGREVRAALLRETRDHVLKLSKQSFNDLDDFA